MRPTFPQAELSARERQDIFVEHYLANGQNGVQAVIAAGYSTKHAGVRAMRLLRMPEVQERVAWRAAEVAEAAQLNTQNWMRDWRLLLFPTSASSTTKMAT